MSCKENPGALLLDATLADRWIGEFNDEVRKRGISGVGALLLVVTLSVCWTACGITNGMTGTQGLRIDATRW